MNTLLKKKKKNTLEYKGFKWVGMKIIITDIVKYKLPHKTCHKQGVVNYTTRIRWQQKKKEIIK